MYLKKLAEKKAPDLNAVDLAGAMKIMDGTAETNRYYFWYSYSMSLAELRAKLA